MSTSRDAHRGFRSWPLGGRVAVVLVAALVVLNVLGWGLDRATGGGRPGGERSSSYATGDDGAAAYADLLERFGTSVSRQTGALADTSLDTGTALVLLDPGFLVPDDTAAVARFVDDGGLLVVAGAGADELTADLLDDPPVREVTGPDVFATLGTDPDFDEVDEVVGTGSGSWSSAGSAVAVVGAPDGDLLVEAEKGDGVIRALADASPLRNERLVDADNALFGLALTAGTPEVVFAEGVHGASDASGLRAIPTAWKVALGALLLAVALAVWSRARRFGPPELADRPLPPPRAAYVDALAAALERSDRDRRELLSTPGRAQGADRDSQT